MKTVKTLILINGARDHRSFYSRVGDELVRRGHSVVYAVDSHYTDVMSPDVAFHQQAHYFSDYFREHRSTATIPKALEGSNLWLAMFPDFDRFNDASLASSSVTWRSHPGYYRDLVATMTSFFWELFETHRFDRVVYEGVTNAFAYIAYLVAEKHGATYVGFAPSRMPNRMYASTSQYHRDPRLPGVYRDLRDGKRTVPDDIRVAVREYLDRFLTTHPDDTVAAYRTPDNPFKRFLRKDPLLRFARALRYELTRPTDHEYAYQVPHALRLYSGAFAWELKRALRLRTLRRSFYKQPDLSRRYFVYPMHFHPESSTSVNAPYFVDELSMIRNISISLPVDVWLYVKDHQHTLAGRQPMSFYEEVARAPNVVLIDPAVDPKKLVAHSLGVVTVTGTMGYEAIVLGKPVFVFGNTFYDFHPLCVRMNSFAGAFEAFQRAPQIHASKEEIFDFVATYFLCTYPGTFELDANFMDPNLVTSVASVVEAPPTVSAAQA